MPRADLLIHSARQVVTCGAGEGARRGPALADAGVIAHGAVAIVDGLIAAVGPSEEIRAAYAAHSEIDATDRILCPGFVDCHTHLVFAGQRADEWERKLAGVPYLEILAGGGGILSTMRATRAAPYRHLLAEARSRLDTMLALGTTTVEIKTGYGLDVETEVELLRVIGGLAQSHACTVVPTLLGAHALPPEAHGDGNAYTQLVCEQMIHAAAAWFAQSPFPAAGSPFFCDVFCESGAFSLEQARRVLTAGLAHGLRPKIHADQFHSLGGTSLAVELRAASADHLDVTTPEEVTLLGASDTAAVLLPAVPFHMGAPQTAPARALVDAGAIVALATDFNPGSAPCYSLPLVMGLACRFLKLSPAEALNACTINAAYALGLHDRFGSLEMGKEADLLVLGLEDYRQIPYWLGANPVVQVIKRGRAIATA